MVANPHNRFYTVVGPPRAIGVVDHPPAATRLSEDGVGVVIQGEGVRRELTS
jgi:hypothetical protein